LKQIIIVISYTTGTSSSKTNNAFLLLREIFVKGVLGVENNARSIAAVCRVRQPRGAKRLLPGPEAGRGWPDNELSSHGVAHPPCPNLEQTGGTAQGQVGQEALPPARQPPQQLGFESLSSAAHHSPRRAFSKFADNVGHGIAARAWSNLRLQEHQCKGQAHCMPHTHWYSRAIRPKPALGGVPCTCLSRLLFSWHLLNVQLCVWTIC